MTAAGSPPGRRSPRRFALAWVLAGTLALAVAANGAVVSNQPAVVTATTVSPLPVTLTAIPATGTTVTAGTIAVTTGLVPTLVPLSTVSLSRSGSQAWDVTLRATAATGITGSESLVVALIGLSTQTLTLLPGSTLPLSTPALTLSDSGLVLTAATTSLVFGCHTCSVTLELSITPAGSSLPLFVYPYTITTAA